MTGVLATSDPLIGSRLGEYEVLEHIGEGGMGDVYRGVQPVIKKRVAIKVLKPFAANAQAQGQALIDEAEAVNSIRHRSIVDIFSLGRLPDGRHYIVMEFLEGQPLDHFLATRGAALGEVVNLLIALCSPLGAAHRANVVHRDLKPSNVFICQGSDGERYLKLLDFGIAKKNAGLGDRNEVTRQTRIMGTPDYMAPEQARGEPVAPATDVYALGVMAYQMLTGHVPFSRAGPMEVLFAHANDPVPPMRTPAVPPALEALVMRMLEKNIETRPQTVEEVRRALVEISKTLDGRRTSFDPATLSDTIDQPRQAVQLTVDRTLVVANTQPDPPQRSSRALVIGLGVLVLLLGIGVAVSFLPSTEAKQPPAVEASPVITPVITPPVAVVEPVVAPPVQVVAPPPVPVEPTAPIEPKPKRVEAPTQASLLQRVTKLEAALKKSTAKGEEPNPAAEALLRKYRVEATMVDTPAERTRFAKTLDDFERSFLKGRR